MSTYAKAKADLERAMRAAGRLEREAFASNPVRPAAITVMQPYAWLIAHAPLWPAAAAKAGRRSSVLAPTTCDTKPSQRARCEEPRHG